MSSPEIIRKKKRKKDLSYEGQVRRVMIHRERANGASANEARRIVNPRIAAIEAARAEMPPASPIDFWITMAHEKIDNTSFNQHTLPLRLRDMYECRVLYVEEIINDIRTFSGRQADECFLEGVRARHIAHAQETVREVVRYAAESAHLSHVIRTYEYGDVVVDPELPQI